MSGAVPLLLEDAIVVTLDDERRVGRFSVAIADGHIAGVLGRAAARRAFPGAERVACSNRIIMPGLVNAHLHPELLLLKGALEERALHDWGADARLNAALRVLNEDAGTPLQRAAVRAALADCALGGTTCIGTYGVAAGSEAVCAAALCELGLRGAITIRDAAFPAEPAGLPAARAGGLGGPIRFYRLHAEEALTEAELRAAAGAHARGDRIVMHAAETAERVALARAAFGTTTIRLLHRHRLLSPRVLLSHAVHVDAEERALIAAAGAAVVASPSAEMKLGDGAARCAEYLRAGITVSIGTDAAVCNNGSDMLLECRTFGLLQKLTGGAASLPAEEVLLAATRHGAAALGCERVGALAAGWAADLVAIDVRNPRLQPLHWRGVQTNVYANIVYAATGQDVTDVLVGGRWIVRRRRLLAADAGARWRALRSAARSLQRLTGST